MPLLGWPLMVVLGSVASAAMAATLVLWPRVPGPRVVKGLARVAMIGTSQVLAIALVAAAANNYGYFYGSWSDLLGGSAGSTAIQHVAGPREGSDGGAVSRTATGRAPHAGVAWSARAQWLTRGRVDQVQITGARSTLSQPAYIYLPPQYFQPSYAHHEFPAVEVMTGYPGNSLNLVKRMHYPDMLLHEIQSGRAKPMVLVMLRPTVAPPRDTECTDVPAGPQAETYLAQDVPTAIRAIARVRPVGWGAMGDSTGGYCATKIAMMHSDVFTAAMSMSGYYHTLKDGTTGDLWGGSSVLRHLNDLEWRLKNMPQPPVSLLLSISRQERGYNGISDTERFLSMARSPMSVDSIIQPHGGHNFGTWSQVMPKALDWLSVQLKA